MSRRPISVLCLVACVTLLWGAWRLVATADRPEPLPDLQLFPPRAPRASPAAVSVPAPSPKKTQTRLADAPAETMPVIRVGLLAEPARSVTIEVSESFVVRPVGGDRVVHKSGKVGPTPVAASGGGLTLGKRELKTTAIEIVPAKSPAVWVDGHQYRGIVRIYRKGPAAGGVMAVNVLPLEEYVASVVDSEMPAAFPDEARKAQAIVARTYAMYQKEVAERLSTADLFASTRSQKYLGYQYREGGKLLAGESEAGRKSAAETRGKICQYGGKIFCTYYCAVCGGSTVQGTEVFSDAAPALASVKCDYCRDARLYRWTAEISKADMQRELEPWFKEKGQKPGPLQTVSAAKAEPPGRAVPDFDVRSGKQSARISGSELRQLLSGRGLYSPRFVINDKGRAFEISGRGHGHGVGLCQWGARGQAIEGKTCEKILNYYYPGASVATRLWK